MKKIFLPLLICVTLFSCKPTTGTVKETAIDSFNGAVIDSLNGESELVVRKRLKAELVKDTTNRIYFTDTAGLPAAPVKVLSARPVKKEYSNYKDIELSYKNVSGKNIAGIKFRWYGLNTFGEPAEVGSLLDD